MLLLYQRPRVSSVFDKGQRLIDLIKTVRSRKASLTHSCIMPETAGRGAVGAFEYLRRSREIFLLQFSGSARRVRMSGIWVLGYRNGDSPSAELLSSFYSKALNLPLQISIYAFGVKQAHGFNISGNMEQTYRSSCRCRIS